MDDPVEEEIPVVLCQPPALRLELFQYPLRARARPYSDVGPISEVSVAHNSGAVRITHTCARDASRTFRLLSQPLQPHSELAAFRRVGDRIMLAPLSAFHSFRYPEQPDAQASGAAPASGAQPTEESLVFELFELAAEARTAGSEFAHRPERRAQQAAADVFNQVNYFCERDSEESRAVVELLRARAEQSATTLRFDKNRDAYLRCLTRGVRSADFFKHKELSFARLLRLGLDERVKKILALHEIISFDELRLLLGPHECNVNDVLRSLQRHGTVLNGVWVARSELVVANDSQWYEVELGARDVTLCLIANNRPILRNKLLQLTRLEPVRLDAILDKLFDYVDGKYVFKHKPDAQFARRFPTLCSQSAQLWTPATAQAISARINDALNRLSTPDAALKNTPFEQVDFKRCCFLGKALFRAHGGVPAAQFLKLLQRALFAETCRSASPNKQFSEIEENAFSSKAREEQLKVIAALKVEDAELVLEKIAACVNGIWLRDDFEEPSLQAAWRAALAWMQQAPGSSFTFAQFRARLAGAASEGGGGAQLDFFELRAMLHSVAERCAGGWRFKGAAGSL